MATGTLVDSNVLLDIFTEDANWLEWSTDALGAAAEAGPLYINPVIYAEVSVRFSRVEEIEDALPSSEFRRAALPWAAAFLAGKVFVSYRRNRGAASESREKLPEARHRARRLRIGVLCVSRDAEDNRRRRRTGRITDAAERVRVGNAGDRVLLLAVGNGFRRPWRRRERSAATVEREQTAGTVDRSLK